jgi:hypothetical protein
MKKFSSSVILYPYVPRYVHSPHLKLPTSVFLFHPLLFFGMERVKCSTLADKKNRGLKELEITIFVEETSFSVGCF